MIIIKSFKCWSIGAYAEGKYVCIQLKLCVNLVVFSDVNVHRFSDMAMNAGVVHDFNFYWSEIPYFSLLRGTHEWNT